MSSSAEQLMKLADMKEKGLLDSKEFMEQKAKVLAGDGVAATGVPVAMDGIAMNSTSLRSSFTYEEREARERQERIEREERRERQERQDRQDRQVKRAEQNPTPSPYFP